MQSALDALPGVRYVEVDFETKQAVLKVAQTFETQKLVPALEEAGFGGSVADVRVLSAELDERDKSEKSSNAPPLPGLSLDERESDSVKTTYSSASFAKHVRINSYLDHDRLRPSDSFRIAVVFDIDDGWHIYGNPLGPGIGKETVVTLQERDGFKFEPTRYSAGHRAEQDFGEAGKTWVWEHTGRTVLFVRGKVDDNLPPGKYVITVEASAQVCAAEVCLPGKAKIPVSFTVVAGDSISSPANSEFFQGYEQSRAP